MHQVDVVLANNDRVTLRVGNTFLKVDADQKRTDVEVEAIALAPVPTPEILWRRPPVLALAAVPGATLGRLGEPSPASPDAWAAVGQAIRTLHDAPLPPWPECRLAGVRSRLDAACEWLTTNDVLPAGVISRNRKLAEAVIRPFSPAFIHGDLHLEHVFVDGDAVAGWSRTAREPRRISQKSPCSDHKLELEPARRPEAETRLYRGLSLSKVRVTNPGFGERALRRRRRLRRLG